MFLSVALPKDNMERALQIGIAAAMAGTSTYILMMYVCDGGGGDGPLAHPLHRHRFCGLFDFFIHHFNVYASFHSATTKRLRTNDVWFELLYALTTTVIVLTVAVCCMECASVCVCVLCESVYSPSIIHGKRFQQKEHAWFA